MEFHNKKKKKKQNSCKRNDSKVSIYTKLAAIGIFRIGKAMHCTTHHKKARLKYKS